MVSLLKMVDRNMRMVRRTLEAYEKSDARPEDLVRLYDILLQNQSDMEQIEILQVEFQLVKGDRPAMGCSCAHAGGLSGASRMIRISWTAQRPILSTTRP